MFVRGGIFMYVVVLGQLSSMPARVEFEFLHVAKYQCCGRPATESSNIHFTSAAHYSDAVDVYNIETGAWSTAKLSVARGDLAAASVGNIVLVAGGNIGNVFMRDYDCSGSN
jgi:hypothetical protein